MNGDVIITGKSANGSLIKKWHRIWDLNDKKEQVQRVAVRGADSYRKDRVQSL